MTESVADSPSDVAGTAAPRRPPRVALIVPSRNTLGQVRRFLQHLIIHDRYPDYEVIVVDAASTDGTPVWLRGQERLAVVDVAFDPGCTAAMTLGMAHVTPGSDVIVVNATDVVPGADWIADLQRRAYDADDAGIVTWRPLDDAATSRSTRIRRGDPAATAPNSAAGYDAILDVMYLRADAVPAAATAFGAALTYDAADLPDGANFWALPNQPDNLPNQQPDDSALDHVVAGRIAPITDRYARFGRFAVKTALARTVRRFGSSRFDTGVPLAVGPDLVTAPEHVEISDDGYWGTRARELAEGGAAGWLDDPWVLDTYVFPKVFGPGVTGTWGQGYLDRFDIPRGMRWLSIGCGGGNNEVTLGSIGAYATMLAVDPAADAIAVGREQAAAAGLGGLTFDTFDGNTDELPENAFDVVHMNMSLHHVMRLEHLLWQIRRSLKPGGWVILNEYIGPNQFQYTPLQIQTVRDLLDMLPPRLRWNYNAKFEKRQYPVYSRSFWDAFDPTEACRSEDIDRCVRRAFPGVLRRDYYGAILNPLLENIIGNFDRSDADDLALLRMCLGTDQRLTESGALDSNFALYVGRKRPSPLIDAHAQAAAAVELDYRTLKNLRARHLL